MKPSMKNPFQREEPLKVCITHQAFKDSLALAWAKRLPTTAGSVSALLPWNPVRGNYPFLSTCPCTLWACLTSSHNYINISQFLKNSTYRNTYSHILSLIYTHTYKNLWLDLFLWVNPNTPVHICSQLLLIHFCEIHFMREKQTVQGSQVGHRKV